MAVTVVPAIILVRDVPSADLPDAAMTAIATAADGFRITGLDNKTQRVTFEFLDSGSASVVTINAGDNPPALRAGLGNLTVTLAASDKKYVAIEAALYMQDDGTIEGTVDVDATASVRAVVNPRDI